MMDRADIAGSVARDAQRRRKFLTVLIRMQVGCSEHCAYTFPIDTQEGALAMLGCRRSPIVTRRKSHQGLHDDVVWSKHFARGGVVILASVASRHRTRDVPPRRRARESFAALRSKRRELRKPLLNYCRSAASQLSITECAS